MTKKYYRDDLNKLKERRGGASEELKTINKKNKKLVSEVKSAIEKMDEPATVPALAEVIDYPTSEIFFAIMCLRKYNQLQIVSKRGEFPTFAFKEVKN